MTAATPPAAVTVQKLRLAAPAFYPRLAAPLEPVPAPQFAGPPHHHRSPSPPPPLPGSRTGDDDAADKELPRMGPGASSPQRRLAQRQKQIDFGKNTIGYQNYSMAVPRYHYLVLYDSFIYSMKVWRSVHFLFRQERKRGDPVTPTKESRCSTRTWVGQIRRWRRALHKWDNMNDQAFMQQKQELQQQQKQPPHYMHAHLVNHGHHGHHHHHSRFSSSDDTSSFTSSSLDGASDLHEFSHEEMSPSLDPTDAPLHVLRMRSPDGPVPRRRRSPSSHLFSPLPSAYELDAAAYIPPPPPTDLMGSLSLSRRSPPAATGAQVVAFADRGTFIPELMAADQYSDTASELLEFRSQSHRTATTASIGPRSTGSAAPSADGWSVSGESHVSWDSVDDAAAQALARGDLDHGHSPPRLAAQLPASLAARGPYPFLAPDMYGNLYTGPPGSMGNGRWHQRRASDSSTTSVSTARSGAGGLRGFGRPMPLATQPVSSASGNGVHPPPTLEHCVSDTELPSWDYDDVDNIYGEGEM
ncbi:hypothetical protein BC828DRAFT_390563 [Blastocladiella britannica]|nr:hypothetical protein BC828DRAFT_390563 [Blastocladiella britannica]